LNEGLERFVLFRFLRGEADIEHMMPVIAVDFFLWKNYP
jgi:hypothetical protein